MTWVIMAVLGIVAVGSTLILYRAVTPRKATSKPLTPRKNASGVPPLEAASPDMHARARAEYRRWKPTTRLGPARRPKTLPGQKPVNKRVIAGLHLVSALSQVALFAVAAFGHRSPWAMTGFFTVVTISGTVMIYLRDTKRL